MTVPTPVLFALTPGGVDLARRLQHALPGAEVHARDGGDVPVDGAVEHLREVFRDGRPLVGICAAGILIRAVAPLLADKRAEPPVIAVAEDGSAVLPLLGGHRGANRLARQIADTLGIAAAVTTAGDAALGLGLDDPPPGWRVANPARAKAVAAGLLAGETVRLDVEAGDAGWLYESGADFGPDGGHGVRVTDRRPAPDETDLVLHPPVLALGVGAARNAPTEEVATLADRALADAGLAAASVACVVSLDLKSDETAVLALADRLGVPARFFTAAELEAETPRLANPSETVFAEVGCHGVAEGAALAATGDDGTLVVEKRKSANATVAVARTMRGIDPATVGRARGRLSVVGLGPGTPAWRCPAATAALARAGDVVGYKLYLDLAGALIAGKRLHHSELSQEEARCRKALDLAAEGREVALVCSGDAGIYALATLVFELLDRDDDPAWNRLAIEVVPGISALQAAAARAGAPLGHDFCTISLSDLLTPWQSIEARLEAAGRGDFVVAFYNPVSKRRRTQLATARDILLHHRPGTTPVILARNLGRPEETVETTTLAALDPEQVDMLTVVLVGNSETRTIERGRHPRTYTPRGYAKKLAGE